MLQTTEIHWDLCGAVIKSCVCNLYRKNNYDNAYMHISHAMCSIDMIHYMHGNEKGWTSQAGGTFPPQIDMFMSAQKYVYCAFTCFNAFHTE